MRLYGRKIADNAINRRISRNRQISEGILWTVDEESENCTVKIQGSNEQIVAHYPRNQKAIPSWLKPGNAVQLLHKAGNRNYIEVVGQGRAIPNPVSGNQFPGLSTLSNTLLTAVHVTAVSAGSDSVRIDSGVQYRIGGTTYTLTGTGDNYLVMDEDDITMDEYPYYEMDQLVIDLPSSPISGKFRYDILVAGTDSGVDVVSGTEVSSNPALPTVPADHVLLEKILRIGGETGTTDERIGQSWSSRSATSLVVTGDTEMAWSTSTNYPETSFTATLYDQYGSKVSNSAGWQLTCNMIYGSGQVYSGQSGYGTSVVQVITGNSYTFKYQRNQSVNERHPVILISLDNPSLSGSIVIELLDIAGDLIAGQL